MKSKKQIMVGEGLDLVLISMKNDIISRRNEEDYFKIGPKKASIHFNKLEFGDWFNKHPDRLIGFLENKGINTFLLKNVLSRYHWRELFFCGTGFRYNLEVNMCIRIFNEDHTPSQRDISVDQAKRLELITIKKLPEDLKKDYEKEIKYIFGTIPKKEMQCDDVFDKEKYRLYDSRLMGLLLGSEKKRKMVKKNLMREVSHVKPSLKKKIAQAYEKGYNDRIAREEYNEGWQHSIDRARERWDSIHGRGNFDKGF